MLKPTVGINIEKNFAPFIWASISCTVGKGRTSLSILWFSGLRSTQIRTFPDFLLTTTILAHHEVGLVTFEIMPDFSIVSKSSTAFGRRGRGTCLGVKIECGFSSGQSCIWYSPLPFCPLHEDVHSRIIKSL